MRATDDGQVKTNTCLPVMVLVPTSFGDGRPVVFGSVAHGVCPSDACVLRVHPRLTVGTDCCRARSLFMRGCRQGLPPSHSESQRCSARRVNALSSLSTA